MVTLPTVWLHGAGLSPSTWGEVASGFSDTMLLCLPGHGGAPRLPSPSVEAFADAVEPMLPDRFGLIAHSLGGMVALELALRHTQRVDALVLIETVPTVRTPLAQRVQAFMALQVMKLLGPRGLARVSGWGQSPAVATHLQQQLSTLGHAAMLDALKAAYTYDALARLPVVEARTLILAGRQSRQIAASSQRMGNAIPGAVCKVLPGGHLLHIDSAQLVTDAIKEFLIDDR
ncbi:MAG: alpha/beta hydrolase [Pseudomonadota bacterium]